MMGSKQTSVVGDLESTVQKDLVVPLTQLQTRLASIRCGWHYEVSRASNEADLKSAVQSLSRDTNQAWAEYEKAKAASIRKVVNEASDRLRSRYGPGRKARYVQKLSLAVLTAPLVSVLLLIMSLRALHIWIIAAIVVWCSGAGLWMKDHATLSIIVASSILLCVGLVFNLYALHRCFALDWEFHDADRFARVGGPNISASSMDRALEGFREPTLKLPAPRAREAYESPILTGTRQGIISQSWQGALLGLAVNVGFQVWDELTGPAKQKAAEDRAKALYNSQLEEFRSRSFDSIRDSVRKAGDEQVQILLDRVAQIRTRPQAVGGAQNALVMAEASAQGAFELSFVFDLVRQFNRL